MRVLKNSAFLVAMRSGETPVPIPNTMVKTWAADGTALETVWESRWPPKLKKEKMDTEPLWKFRIDTGTDEQQLIAANPISREVLLEITGFTSD